MQNVMRAITRIVHLNLVQSVCHVPYTRDIITYPTILTKWLEAIGMTVPPIADPVALIPNASDLRFLNQCEMMIGIGPKIIPHEIPVRKPWQRRSCQNSLHSAMAAVATTKTTLKSGWSVGDDDLW
jgi:hypothetical protein